MILNLPDRINANVLEKFDLGSSEALKDTLLQSCYCDIAPIREFLQDNHSILVGSKGAGKTAVFKLLKVGHLTFEKSNKDKTIIITLDEPIEYATAAATIEASLKSTVTDPFLRYQFLWEIYILYRICLALKDRNQFDPIKEKIESLCQLFSSERPQLSLFQLLTSSKKTVGFKMDMKNPAFPTPDFYISSEPSPQASVLPSITTIDIESYKEAINNQLKQSGFRIYVLVDNLDDFVAKDSYNTQKTILQGILSCSRSYAAFSEIRLKISLREDLFRKLDFSQLGGYDKLAPDTITLVWNDADIRYFIARRLAVNLMKTLRLKGLKLDVNQQSLYLPPPEKKISLIERIIYWIFQKTGRQLPIDESAARRITAQDQISRQITTAVFPREVLHRTANGSQERVELFSYLSTHFDLGDGHTTPRIILLYMQKLVQVASKYYRENKDEVTLKRTDRYEYALFKRAHFLDAYSSLQKDMLAVFKSCMTFADWQSCTEVFFAKKGRKLTFSFQTLCNMIDLSGDDAIAYAAYLTHLGVLKCKDSHVQHQKRTYELPVLLQYIWED